MEEQAFSLLPVMLLVLRRYFDLKAGTYNLSVWLVANEAHQTKKKKKNHLQEENHTHTEIIGFLHPKEVPFISNVCTLQHYGPSTSQHTS